MSTPQQLTQQQIQNYQNIIDNQGINGVSSVYQDLASKGYNYAGWADGVATGNTTTGQAALGYMQNSAGHDLTSNQISNIRVDMLNGYLNALNEQTANGGNVSRDVDYGETRQFHEQVFNRNGLSIDNWTLNDPMEMIRKYGGGTAEQERLWQEIRDTGGSGLDAIAASTGLSLVMLDLADGDYTADSNGNYVYTPVASGEMTIPGGNTVSNSDLQKIAKWMGDTPFL